MSGRSRSGRETKRVETADRIVVGGGLVGLATALALARRGVRPLLLEAETTIARHQSGHNSGVIHSGLYYAPGSRKARFCVSGRRALYDLCAEFEIPHRRIGKLVLATREEELPRLAELERRGTQNGLQNLERLDAAGIQEVEPEARGIAGLRVVETGVVDYATVATWLAAEIKRLGGEVRTGARVGDIQVRSNGVELGTSGGDRFAAPGAVVCAGLQCDRLARLAGAEPELAIVPFRGDYYELVPERRGLVRGLIYPVPDPEFPFLGVHLTRTVTGRVEVGPNAVLALSRGRYRRAAVTPRDAWEALTEPGLWRLIAHHWRTGVGELARAWSLRRFTHDLQRLVPAIEQSDLRRSGCGIRAQAIRRDGSLADDFEILEQGPCLHVLNAPSPGGTASLAIGEELASRALEAPS